MQPANGRRVGQLRYLLHLLRRVWLEILSDAHVLIEVTFRVAAQRGARNGQRQRVAQAFFNAQLAQQECICKNLDGLDSDAAVNGVRQGISLETQIGRIGGMKRHQD